MKLRSSHAEMLDLAFTNQVFDRPRDLFCWNVRIDPMLIEEVDPVGVEPHQRRVGYLPDVRGRLSRPACLPFSIRKPNFVAITT